MTVSLRVAILPCPQDSFQFIISHPHLVFAEVFFEFAAYFSRSKSMPVSILGRITDQ